jgi:uncharacterized membrane protein
VSIDPETFGRLSERLARFLGTGKFLFWQTLLVLVWITLNLVAVSLRWDPYPFILLNLAFSTQAAYAAPLILLAQNRQDNRDRVSLEEDRARAARTKEDTEFLARELAALRLAVGEVATRDYLRGELDRLRTDLNAKPRKTRPNADTLREDPRWAEPDRVGSAHPRKPDPETTAHHSSRGNPSRP